MKTQQNLEKEVEDLKEEVEARKQHEQGLRRQLEVGMCTCHTVSLYVMQCSPQKKNKGYGVLRASMYVLIVLQRVPNIPRHNKGTYRV